MPYILYVKIIAQDAQARKTLVDYYSKKCCYRSLSNPELDELHSRICECNAANQESGAYLGDSGVDLVFPAEVKIMGEGIETPVYKCGMGISCMMKDENGEKRGYLMFPRSSVANTPLMLANSVGVIDAGYRGEIIAAFRVFMETNYNVLHTVDAGTRLVQITAPDLRSIQVVLVDDFGEQGENKPERGARGFGSSGL